MGRTVQWLCNRLRETVISVSFIWTVFHLTVLQRKVLLDLARIQPPVLAGSRFLQRNAGELQTTIPSFGNDRQYISHMTLYDFVHTHFSSFQSPIVSGFISMLLRFLPYSDYSSIDELRLETLNKEIDAAEHTYHPTTLDYRSFLSPTHSNRFIPLFGNRSNPAIASTLFTAFSRAKLVLSKHDYLVPRVSRKTIMAHPYYHSWEPFRRYSSKICNLAHIEKVRMRTGTWLFGLTEMRMSWKPNDLKPRVYYARGPSVHPSSSVIQEIFNVFVDSLSMTHRKLRFNLFDLEELDPDFYLFVYDYASFTSTLHEIRNFTAKLAEFCRGTTVRVLDAYHGIIEKDLGDILDEYNQVCNISLDFDVSQLKGVLDLVIRHNCGALGIPGNITSCTLLHGIHLAFVLDSLFRGKVIGDDAIGMFLPSELPRSELFEQLGNIGVLSESKTEFWDVMASAKDAWKYVKRPIHRSMDQIVRGTLPDVPSLDFLFEIRNPRHTHFPITTTRRLEVASMQIIRFWRSLLFYDLSKEEEALIITYYRSFLVSETLERFAGGVFWSKRDRGGFSTILVPSEDQLIHGNLESFLQDIPMAAILVPDTSVHRRCWIMAYGSVFDAYSSSLLSYLRSLEILESKRMSCRKLVRDCKSGFLEELFLGRTPFPNSYEVVDELPEWAYPLLQQYVFDSDLEVPLPL